jgi:hypothetical protein
MFNLYGYGLISDPYPHGYGCGMSMVVNLYLLADISDTKRFFFIKYVYGICIVIPGCHLYSRRGRDPICTLLESRRRHRGPLLV